MELKIRETEAAIKTLESSVKKQKKELKEADGERLLQQETELKLQKKRLDQEAKQLSYVAKGNEQIRAHVFLQLQELEKVGKQWPFDTDRSRLSGQLDLPPGTSHPIRAGGKGRYGFPWKWTYCNQKEAVVYGKGDHAAGICGAIARQKAL